jgi:hypothetical protein
MCEFAIISICEYANCNLSIAVAYSKITMQQLQQEIDYLQKEIEKRDLEKVRTPEVRRSEHH